MCASFRVLALAIMRQAHIRPRALRALMVLLAALFGIVGTAPAALAAPPSVSEQVGPSIVFIRTIYKGYVQIPLRNSQPEWTPQITMTATCTGYAVDSVGSIATAGHCVNSKDDEIGDEFRKQAVESLASVLNWSSDEATKIYAVATKAKWPVVGSTSDPSSSPTRSVSVQQPSGPSQVITDWVDAQVVDYQTFSDGDNAVLRVNGYKLPPLVISPDEPKPGTAITAIGFPGAVRVVTDTSVIPQPSYKTGTVSSRQVMEGGVTKTEISAGMGQGMSGGPTVDADGSVIGTNSSVTKDEAASFDFITDNVALRSYLESHGVQLSSPQGNALTSSKNMWLWLGLLIGAVVLIALILLAVILRRRSKRRRVMSQLNYGGAQGFGAPMQQQMQQMPPQGQPFGGQPQGGYPQGGQPFGGYPQAGYQQQRPGPGPTQGPQRTVQIQQGQPNAPRPQQPQAPQQRPPQYPQPQGPLPGQQYPPQQGPPQQGPPPPR